MEKYSEFSYRDIQVRAKELGIPANKKRDVLIELIVELESAESSPVAEETVEVAEPVVEEKEEAIEEPVAEEPQTESASESEVMESDAVVGTENALDVTAEYFDSHEGSREEVAEEEEADYEECQTGAGFSEEDLVDVFEQLALRGIPNPTGTKTAFESPARSSSGAKIDWGIDFTAAENDENDSNTPNYQRPAVTFTGKHTLFASPGPAAPTSTKKTAPAAASHWTYESFDKKPEPLGATTPGKMLVNSEERMNFWLAKGPKTPLR